jgi:four helix bundle protein
MGAVMVAKSFEDLEVFQRAYRLSLEIHRVSLTMPKIEQHALGDQVRRASKSIPVNIAEGFGKQVESLAEFRRFLRVATGSADEMRVWVRYAFALGYIEEATWRRWRDEYHAIAKMLQGLRRRSGAKAASDP